MSIIEEYLNYRHHETDRSYTLNRNGIWKRYTRRNEYK